MQPTYLIKNKTKKLQFRGVIFIVLLLLPLLSKAQPVGANMGNPLVMGTYGAGTFSYSDTKNNNTANGYLNDYGQASDDIFYKFTVQGSTQITISHCGSGFDTYMHLLNSAGGLITYNDDNGPACTGVTASISTTLAAGTYFIVSEGYSTSSGNITTSVSLTVQPPPAPPDTRNFIKVWEATAPETDPNALMTKSLREVKHSVTYFDGLGRPEQTIVKKGSLSSNGNTDLASPVVYDQFGREAQKYLPYPSPSSDGLYKSNILTEQNTFYTGTSSPVAGQGEIFFYSKTDFEASPLNRTTKTYAPGNSWVGAGRGIEAKYWINTATDAVRIWTVADVPGDFGTYSTTATYPAGELYKNATADETGNQVIEFKDKEGKVILKKIQLASSDPVGTGSGHGGWLCTYYIYDDLNQLRAVIQPKAVEAMDIAGNWTPDITTLNELVFRYEYDARGRMVMKKVPGAGAVQMVYDARDRLVMTQDANLNTARQWMVTVYENNLNRPVNTYLINDASNGNYHRGLAYNSTSYPIVTNYTSELLTETHYDDYANLPTGLSGTLNNSGYATYLTASSSSPDYAEPISQSVDVKGMVTWTRVKVLGPGSQYISTVNIYDVKGRVIQAQTLNATGGLDVVTNQFSFSNQPLRNHVRHQKLGATIQTYDIATKNNYDDLGRVIGIEKNLNNSGWKTISSLAYDALGQLKTRKLSPAFNSNAGLETLNYDYNIRGWLLGVNSEYARDANSTNYFGYNLGYDKAFNNIMGGQAYANPQYNGNIAGMVWKSKGDGEKRKYDFGYDATNRIMKADFTQYTGGSFNQIAGINFSTKMGDGLDPATAYDANGNILKMQQWGLKLNNSSLIDDLKYTYPTYSNKLHNVIDFANEPTTTLGDFRSKNHPQENLKTQYIADPAHNNVNNITDYFYDANGNLIIDYNKEIHGGSVGGGFYGPGITYNYLNLPILITMGEFNGSIQYTYDAIGNKLQKTVAANGQSTKVTTYIGSPWNIKTSIFYIK